MASFVKGSDTGSPMGRTRWGWRRRAVPALVGVVGVLLLAGTAEARQLPSAGGGAPTTTSTSSSSASGFEAPPQCTEIGTTRQEVSTSQQFQTGPACIGVGNRDVPNPSPACGGLPWGVPSPDFGQPLLIATGTEHVNKHTHTLTLTCVPPTPALPLPWLFGLGATALGTGAALLRRARSRN